VKRRSPNLVVIGLVFIATYARRFGFVKSSVLRTFRLAGFSKVDPISLGPVGISCYCVLNNLLVILLRLQLVARFAKA